MSKMKRNLLKLFMLMMVMCASVLFNAKEASAASKTTVEFINVATKANTNGKYKGDATLIKYKDKYFLIDTGYGYAFGTSSDPLTKGLNSLVGNGGYLSGIIITHSHSDHYGALSKILDTSVVKKGSVKNGGTTIYYNDTYVETNLTKALTKARNKGIATQSVKKGSVCNAYTGNTNTYATARSNNGLYIYGAAMDLISNDAYGENQSSMVVQLKADKLKGIFLGDLQIKGMNAMKNKYGDNIMAVDYDICKVGHHGLRTENSELSGIDSEVKNFYMKFKAEDYIFTVHKDHVPKNYMHRHNYLKEAIIYYKLGNMHYISDNIKFEK